MGRFLREEAAVDWTLEDLNGTVENGALTVASDPMEQAGTVTATVAGLTGQARARVVRPLPWNQTFDAYEDGTVPPGWVNAAGAAAVSVVTLDGNKVLQKAPLGTLFKRARVFFGPVHWSNYTFQADVRAAERRRQMADVGITVQRYSLVLYGTNQRLKLEPWEPEIERTVTVPFAWSAGHVVPLETACREPAGRPGARARQRRGRLAMLSRLTGSSTEPIRSVTARDRPDSSSTRSSGPTLIISC